MLLKCASSTRVNKNHPSHSSCSLATGFDVRALDVDPRVSQSHTHVHKYVPGMSVWSV